MIIDTDKLRSAIDAREEQLLKQKYDGDYMKCPMSFLNSSEKRVLERNRLVQDIEDLMATLLTVGCDPTVMHH